MKFSLKKEALFDTPPTRFQFEFSSRDSKSGLPLSRASICEIDLPTIHATIQELGFTFEYEEHAGYWQNIYKNDNYYIRIAYVGGDKKKQDCMITLTISEREIKK